MWFACLVVIAACAASDDVPAPAISGVQPDHGSPGSSVMVSGDFFCGDPDLDSDSDPNRCDSTGFVQFGQMNAATSQYTNTSIIAEVPGGPQGVVRVVVSVNGKSSNSVSFTIE